MEAPVCPEHNQRLEKFCENDQEVICLQCERNLHRIHQCLSLEEAAERKKKEVSERLETLRKRLKQMNKRREEWEETKDYIQTQTEQSEAILRAEFEELRAFLQQEEENRVSLLKQERDVKTGVLTEKIHDLQNQIQTLTKIIRDLEASVRQKDLLFLQDYKHTRKSSRSNVLEPVCLRDILINSASHLGILKFQVWKKMKNIVKFAPVTFDPNTAQSNLIFSESLTCVRYSSRIPVPENPPVSLCVRYSSKTPVPETPERCVNRVCVLGTPGFSSGRHCWTVDVGQGQDWYIGVARESIQRKSTVFLEPAEGFWVIGRTGRDSYWAQTASRSRLTVKQPPQTVTVEVDYGKGKVAFVNDTDRTVMHMFKDKFTEKIFPYFSPGLYQEGALSCPLGICGHSISLLMD
ncbi:unnamed protein product [Knipowitschia caucasica]|uniref:Zinc-binding protein A33-like n=2 Tax=Knipowitschia caucasica TaxID=637954 RepID=A0AAV2L058_KNICA